MIVIATITWKPEVCLPGVLLYFYKYQSLEWNYEAGT